MESDDPTAPLARTERSRVRRNRARGAHDRETVNQILDTGCVAHIGWVMDGAPRVTPTLHWREGDRVYWHGAAGSQMIRAVSSGAPVCVTVSHIDGLVLARSAFHHSVNYRSVMLFGTAEPVTDLDARAARLKALINHIAPGRWDTLRPITEAEIRGTGVVGMDIAEGAAKVRTGPPVDDEEDYALPIWAGVAPLRMRTGAPIPDPRQHPDAPPPPALGAPFAGGDAPE